MPHDLMENGQLVKALPAFFRTLRGQKPTPDEMRKIAEKIRKGRPSEHVAERSRTAANHNGLEEEDGRVKRRGPFKGLKSNVHKRLGDIHGKDV